ncbi:DcaP family trimeric outer membrane transporter [Marinobacter daepoensis]|uniref:DcaP family trimeric outer membrane transporter n=1 Tax=Marinobacter daepoensis TaxID=262077 RepID=UPI001FD4568B|nr:DcaP family trimeric outer membrane transporter [Marinobacter daepoensis]
MTKNKLSLSITALSGALMMGLANPASAIEFKTDDATVDIYGYARLNASYDIDEDISKNTGTRSGDFSQINTGAAEDSEASGYFGADAVQSRLGITTKLSNGLKINVEGDFRGGSSGGQLRLRHAYGQYKNWILGRTWSNYNSFVGNTSVLEMDGVAGNAGLYNRTAQVRYTTGNFSVAVEDPKSKILGESSKNGLPTLTARYESKAGALKYSTAALLQEVGYDDGNTDDSALGFAVFGAAKYQLTDDLSIQGNVNYTDGANGYLWRSGTNYYGEDAYLNGDSVETIEGYSANLGATLNVGPGALSVVYGLTSMDWDDAKEDGLDVADKHERNTNAFITYKWSPLKSVTLGVEYGRFEVKKVSGDEGDANRLMFAAQYNF